MKYFKLLAAAVFTISLIVSNALTADGKINGIDAQMWAFNERFNQVVADKDMEGFLSLYSEQAIWIAPATPPTVGHGEPRALFQFMIENDGKLSHSIDKLFISDDGSQVVMIGTADVLVEQVGMDVMGTYLFVLEPKEDRWVIVTDMWHQHSDK